MLCGQVLVHVLNPDNFSSHTISLFRIKYRAEYPLSVFANDSTGCSDCVEGKFSASSGSSVCQLCGAGRYSQNKMSASCRFCEQNRFSVDTAYGNSHCTHCPRGKISFVKIGAGSCSRGSMSPTPAPSPEAPTPAAPPPTPLIDEISNSYPGNELEISSNSKSFYFMFLGHFIIIGVGATMAVDLLGVWVRKFSHRDQTNFIAGVAAAVGCSVNDIAIIYTKPLYKGHEIGMTILFEVIVSKQLCRLQGPRFCSPGKIDFGNYIAAD